MLGNTISEKQLERLVTNKLTLNRAALTTIHNATGIPKSRLEKAAIKAIREYRARFKRERAAGLSVKEATAETLAERRLIVTRMQSLIVYEVSQDIKEEYKGERYRWLPSGAQTPDPKHQLNYGKIFIVGRGEMPGDRWGCQCGMEILVDEKELFEEAN